MKCSSMVEFFSLCSKYISSLNVHRYIYNPNIHLNGFKFAQAFIY